MIPNRSALPFGRIAERIPSGMPMSSASRDAGDDELEASPGTAPG